MDNYPTPQEVREASDLTIKQWFRMLPAPTTPEEEAAYQMIIHRRDRYIQRWREEMAEKYGKKG